MQTSWCPVVSGVENRSMAMTPRPSEWFDLCDVSSVEPSSSR